MTGNTIIWIYIVLLLAGGLFGFYKAGSKVSLITAAVTAAILTLVMIPGLFQPRFVRGVVDVVLGALIIVFVIRLTKTRKFMPSGLMLTMTVAALVLRHILA